MSFHACSLGIPDREGGHTDYVERISIGQLLSDSLFSGLGHLEKRS
jgi:hypothetical protein